MGAVRVLSDRQEALEFIDKELGYIQNKAQHHGWTPQVLILALCGVVWKAIQLWKRQLIDVDSAAWLFLAAYFLLDTPPVKALLGFRASAAGLKGRVLPSSHNYAHLRYFHSIDAAICLFSVVTSQWALAEAPVLVSLPVGMYLVFRGLPSFFSLVWLSEELPLPEARQVQSKKSPLDLAPLALTAFALVWYRPLARVAPEHVELGLLAFAFLFLLKLVALRVGESPLLEELMHLRRRLALRQIAATSARRSVDQLLFGIDARVALASASSALESVLERRDEEIGEVTARVATLTARVTSCRSSDSEWERDALVRELLQAATELEHRIIEWEEAVPLRAESVGGVMAEFFLRKRARRFLWGFFSPMVAIHSAQGPESPGISAEVRALLRQWGQHKRIEVAWASACELAMAVSKSSILTPDERRVFLNRVSHVIREHRWYHLWVRDLRVKLAPARA